MNSGVQPRALAKGLCGATAGLALIGAACAVWGRRALDAFERVFYRPN